MSEAERPLPVGAELGISALSPWSRHQSWTSSPLAALPGRGELIRSDQPAHCQLVLLPSPGSVKIGQTLLPALDEKGQGQGRAS